jgi:outer membrane protein assembly factor BamB
MRLLTLHVLVTIALVLQLWPAPKPSAAVASPPFVESPRVVAVPSAPAPAPPAVESSDEEAAAAPTRYGYVNAASLPLRDRPSPASPVTARVDVSSLEAYDMVSIHDVHDGFLLVSYDGREGSTVAPFTGWVRWGEVVPDSAALVLDAATGETLATRPLDVWSSAIVFSPDGSRGLLWSTIQSCGDEGPGVPTVYEVSTEDLAVVRTIEAPRTSGYALIAAAYYDPRSSTLCAALIDSDDGRLSIATVDERGGIVAPKTICTGVAGLAVSRDRRVAVGVLGNEDHTATTTRGFALDLVSLEIRNHFSTPEGVVIGSSADLCPSTDGGTIVVDRDGEVLGIDTGTGRVAWRVRAPGADAEYIWRRGDPRSEGAPFAIAYSGGGNDGESRPTPFWIVDGAAKRLDRRIATTCERAGARFGVDETGERLYRLDENGRIVSSSPIARPDLKGTMKEGRLETSGLVATPDGKRVILLLFVPSGC